MQRNQSTINSAGTVAWGTMRNIPRIVIAGTHSGCGKTTIARGVMDALTRRGLAVQPFKVGPDFIDPTHHTVICGRVSRNLDPFMMGETGVLETFMRASQGADVAVIEGVMGMYDGLEGSDEASTAHVMRVLEAPAVLVVDVRGMSRSANAVVKGFREFGTGAEIAGVVFNRIGSPRHRSMIEASLETRPFGFVPRDESCTVGSRHLGLKMAHELLEDHCIGDLIAKSCDIDALLDAARATPALPDAPVQEPEPESVRIGVAKDEAFCFYYQDNIDRLHGAGASIIPFSPLHDPFPAIDAFYLGGGYPELHARALEGSGFGDAVRKAVDDGMPVYAECGGLIALTRSIRCDNREYRMAGVLPGRSCMTGRIQALGYSDGEWTGGPHYASSGSRILGHEFHYSRVECESDARFAIRLSRGKGIVDGMDGLYVHQALATYAHAYFSPEFARSLVASASAYRRS
ncbi:MAG TPA: cobyrinate a,c-diamide synthase [Methanoregulaceae archaeon]|nr:cobyrinate a,c-diamide synthase [Methanoregulaceae archaeon]